MRKFVGGPLLSPAPQSLSPAAALQVRHLYKALAWGFLPNGHPQRSPFDRNFSSISMRWSISVARMSLSATFLGMLDVGRFQTQGFASDMFNIESKLFGGRVGWLGRRIQFFVPVLNNSLMLRANHTAFTTEEKVHSSSNIPLLSFGLLSCIRLNDP